MASSVDPDGTARNETAHQDLHCLQRCQFWFTGLKGVRQIIVYVHVYVIAFNNSSVPGD